MAGLLIAAGVWLWTVLFPSPERVIRKRLAELAKSVSFGGKESPVAILANSQRVAGFFTADVEIRVEVPGRPAPVLNGREELFQAAMQMRSLLGGLQVDFLDVNLALAPDKQSAEAHLTLRGKIAGEKDVIVQELKLLLNKAEGNWRIKKIETVKTLSKSDPLESSGSDMYRINIEMTRAAFDFHLGTFFQHGTNHDKRGDAETV